MLIGANSLLFNSFLLFSVLTGVGLIVLTKKHSMFLHGYFMSKFFRRTVLSIWILLILWLSLDPSPPIPEHGILGWDKFLHAFAYGSLTLLGGWALSDPLSLPKSSWCKVACGSILLGIFVELLQKTCTVTRMAEFGDVFANAFGAGIVVLGVLSFKQCKRWFLQYFAK